MELTLNCLHPYEYDPSLSAYKGLIGEPFDFLRHPIAPAAGCKVLTWDSPDTRGTWADHGVEGIYVGPAPDHFHGYRIWVPQHSALRISGAVWWFLKPYCSPDYTAVPPGHDDIEYPPTKDRLTPKADGSDLLGRVFREPELGPCRITRLGPIVTRKMLSLSQTNALDSTASNDLPIALGSHHTLYYQFLSTNEEHYSSVEEIMQWITSGPLLKRLDGWDSNLSQPHNTEPSRPASPAVPSSAGVHKPVPQTSVQQTNPVAGQSPINSPQPTPNYQDGTCVPNATQTRVSTRKRKPRDFLTPKMKGKAYSVLNHKPRKQRLPVT
jgi:hypothetical protein